jgi:lysophospholipase L1-like esterase
MRLQSVVLVLLCCGLLTACAEVDPLPVGVFDPGEDSGTADFTVLVALGNSLTAGYQNGGLSESGQRVSYAALISRQLGKTVLSSATADSSRQDFVIPGYGDPGTEGTLQLVNLVPPELDEIDEPGSPVNLGYPAPYNNLAVPGANVGDMLRTVTSPFNPLFGVVLRGRGTMLSQALSLEPTFVILWAGGNDVLGQVRTDIPLTAEVDFESDLRALVDSLLASDRVSGMVVANLFDLLSVPFTTTVPPFVVDPDTRQPVLVNGQRIPLIGPDGPLTLPGPGTPGDRVTLAAAAQLEVGTGIPQPFGTGAPLSDAVVLNLAEQAEIRAATEAFNAIIAEVAAEAGIPLVDADALFREVAQGLEVGGIEITAEFLTGGSIGLDGIHPTDLGHAILANAFIETINDAYGARIPVVDLSEFVDTIPPVPQG